MKLIIYITAISLLALQVACTDAKKHGASTDVPTNYINDSIIILNNEICDIVIDSRFKSEILPVNEFKDSLILTIDCVKSHFGVEGFNDTIYYVEKFKDESSIIKLSEKVGIRVCVGRIQMNGAKYYIYSTHLYGKTGDCWKDIRVDADWKIFNLGCISGGLSFGNYGTANAIGYRGELKIE